VGHREPLKLAEEPMAGIRCQSVRKLFGHVEALKSVSLEIRDQEFTVLLGPSGCGKTTLLRIIAGLETETEGDVYIGETRVNGLPPRRREIAMVFQNYAVFPHMTVFENIAFGLRMKKMREDEIQPRVEHAAAMMHIEQLLERYSGQLSGGQRQRVAVSRALAVEPQVLLMDEPLSNLDALLRLEMRAELKSLLQESRTTTIYVTHDQVEAMSLADRIAVMWHGEIVQYDVPIKVYQEPETTFVGGFIGSPPMNFLDLRIERQGSEAAGRLGDARIAVPQTQRDRLRLGVRPEDFEVMRSGPGEGAFASEVVVVEPLGPHLQLTARVDGQMIRVTAPPDLNVRPGAIVTLRPNPARLRWFDPDSGHALH
jgi:multiple sugar transport system ATP-binding protein